MALDSCRRFNDRRIATLIVPFEATSETAETIERCQPLGECSTTDAA
jgi:hypothetical protein